MKIAVRYFSRGGNTKKLADAIANAVGVTAETTDVPLTEDVDILFLGSSVYAYGVDEHVKDFINGIDVKSFNYIGNDEPQIGVMAQDILAKSPELAKALVTEDENGYYGVKTSDLVFPLIIAVQRLQKEIDELKKNMK